MEKSAEDSTSLEDLGDKKLVICFHRRQENTLLNNQS